MCIACNGALSALLTARASRRDFLKSAALLSASAALGSWGTLPAPALARTSAAPAGMADVIFRGGPILTMTEGSPRTEALAIRGEHILVVGRVEDVESRRAPSTRIVELDGRALLPGLIDPHMHLSSFSSTTGST